MLKKILSVSLLFSLYTCAYGTNQSLDRILPSLNNLSTQEGYSILWQDGHPQFFSQLASSLFTIPTTSRVDLYLVGSDINFTATGIDQDHFNAQHSIIKDLYSTRILRQFKSVKQQDFYLNFTASGFTAQVGETSEQQEQLTVAHKTANWIVKDIHGTVVKHLQTSITYNVIGYYALANLTVSGQVKLNLNNKPIRSGKVIFVRQGPGSKPLKKEFLLNMRGEFYITGLAPGEYKIFYSINQHTVPLRHHFHLNSSRDNVNLILRYRTQYNISLKLTKKGKNIDVQANHLWKNFTISLPLGLREDDEQNELNIIPHFLGDFNSPVKLDTEGNQLSIPYADDNLDQLVFLSWNPQTDESSIKGNIDTNVCQLDTNKKNRLHFSATLKPTAYGPWRLEEKRLYANLALSFQCGPNHAQEITSIPLPQTEVGDINELGELQAELPKKIIKKMQSGKSFSLRWKYIDSNDHSTIVIKLKAKRI